MKTKIQWVSIGLWAVALALPRMSQATMPMQFPTVSSPIVVADHQNLVNLLGGVADAHFATYKIGSERYWLNTVWDTAKGRMSQSRMKGTLDKPLSTSVTRLLSQDQVFSNPHQSDGIFWFTNLYQHPDGILAFIHVERVDIPHNHSRVGLAWSSNGGQTFTYLGHIIAQYNEPDVSNLQGVPYLIKDGYFYAYFHDSAGITAARAPVSEVIAAAKAGQTTPWLKYYNGSFSSPAMGGPFTKLSLRGISHSAAFFSTFTGQYHMVTSVENWSQGDTWIKLWSSSDAINWIESVTIERQPAAQVRAGFQYLSVVDVDGGYNAVVGQKFYLYGVKEADVPGHDALYRWKIDFGPAPDTHRHSFEFSSMQGSGGWYYQYKTLAGAFFDMVWDAAQNGWVGPSSGPAGPGAYPMLDSFGGHPGNAADTALKWIAPRSGVVHVGGSAFSLNPTDGCGDGIQTRIYLNGNNAQWIAGFGAADTIGQGHNFALRVSAGDSLQFQINKNSDSSCDSTGWDPTLEFVPGSWTASTSYGPVQSERWSYRYRSGATAYDMNFDAASGWWRGNEPYSIIGAGWMHPGDSSDSELQWSAPYTGWVRVAGTVKDGDAGCGDGVEVKVLQNDTVVWGPVTVTNGNSAGIAHNFYRFVQPGDRLQFVVNKRANNYCDSTRWNPTVQY